MSNELIKLLVKEISNTRYEDYEGKLAFLLDLYPEMKDNQNFFKNLLSVSPRLFKCFPEDIRNNKNFVFDNIVVLKWEISFIGDNLKKDEDFLIRYNTLKHKHYLLKTMFDICDQSFFADKEFLMANGKESQKVFKQFDNSLKNDKDFIFEFIKKYTVNFSLLNEKLKVDKDIFMYYLNNSDYSDYIYQLIDRDSDIAKDMSIVRICLNKSKVNILNVPLELLNDRKSLKEILEILLTKEEEKTHSSKIFNHLWQSDLFKKYLSNDYKKEKNGEYIEKVYSLMEKEDMMMEIKKSTRKGTLKKY